MLMDFISYDYRKQLGNPGKQQVCVECFFIPGPALCKTETVFEVVDGFLNIYTDLIGSIPFFRIPDCTGIYPEVLFGIRLRRGGTEDERLRLCERRIHDAGSQCKRDHGRTFPCESL